MAHTLVGSSAFCIFQKKITRCIGILSKIRYFVSQQVRVQLYYTLIYLFLTYSLVTWGNTYPTPVQPLVILQKKAVEIITFSDFNSPSSRLLGLLKFGDLIYLDNALFMHDYYSYRLPSTFNNFFKSIKKVHQYATRLASKKSYYLPKVRTNYGQFNIRSSGAKLWNAIKEDVKSASRFRFKELLKESVISKY